MDKIIKMKLKLTALLLIIFVVLLASLYYIIIPSTPISIYKERFEFCSDICDDIFNGEELVNIDNFIDVNNWNTEVECTYECTYNKIVIPKCDKTGWC